ncbi:MAG: hypothetical protein AB7E95_09865, partial [Kiritimatiellales bacterium]
HVMLSKSNFLISLAPYFFPFYTLLVLLLWAVAGFFVDLMNYEVWKLALVGLTWGFHVTFTLYMLSQHQPDVQEHGRLFSYVMIYLINLIFVVLWVIIVGTPTFGGALDRLVSETLSAYSHVWRFFLLIATQVQQMLPVES